MPLVRLKKEKFVMSSTLAQVRSNAVKQRAIALQSHPKHQVIKCYSPRIKIRRFSIILNLEESFNSINQTSLPLPRFQQNQLVCFVGGAGIIASLIASTKTWFYRIEMAQGPEPEMGRIGSETTILLDEADIQAVMN